MHVVKSGDGFISPVHHAQPAKKGNVPWTFVRKSGKGDIGEPYDSEKIPIEMKTILNKILPNLVPNTN